MKKKTLLFLLALSVACAANAFGQADGKKGHRPPPEAFAACKDKKEGDRAEFTGPQGKSVTGTCRREGDQLALRPDHPPKDVPAGSKNSDK